MTKLGLDWWERRQEAGGGGECYTVELLRRLRFELLSGGVANVTILLVSLRRVSIRKKAFTIAEHRVLNFSEWCLGRVAHFKGQATVVYIAGSECFGEGCSVGKEKKMTNKKKGKRGR